MIGNIEELIGLLLRLNIKVLTPNKNLWSPLKTLKDLLSEENQAAWDFDLLEGRLSFEITKETTSVFTTVEQQIFFAKLYTLWEQVLFCEISE